MNNQTWETKQVPGDSGKTHYDKLTQGQVDKVRAYNEENNTDYELPVFKIEHDKKSK